MKAVVVLADPEERLTVDIDGRDRRKFERKLADLGLRPGPIQDVAKQHPETYVAALAYFALLRTGQLEAISFDDFDARVAEITDSEEDSEALENPTKRAR